MKHLLIRADANTSIGTGHIMRCLALAQAWQENTGDVTFLTNEALATGLQNRLKDEGFELHLHNNTIGSIDDARATIKTAKHLDAFLVLDGYQFNSDFQEIIADNKIPSLVIDDYGHADYYHADYVLNQNSYANADTYTNREEKTQLLLGSTYALLRREFSKWRDWQRDIPVKAKKLLVTLGGGDPDNLTLKVLKAIQLLSIPLDTTVLVGVSNPHYDDLKKYIAEHDLAVTLKCNVIDMPERMADADIAIAAGGSTNWEMCFLGLPTAIIVIADNQRAIAQDLHDKNIAINLGWHEDVKVEQIKKVLIQLINDKSTRQHMSENAKNFIDGLGAKRVIQVINQPNIKLRFATFDDCKQVWEWANEASVRAASFSSEMIPWESHVDWFQKKLAQQNSVFYIVENNQGVPIGQVRFELDNDEAVISVSLDANQRGKGYGSALIQKGTNALFNHTKLQLIHAYIKIDNIISCRAFEKAEYILKEITTYADYKAFHMIRTKGNL